MPLYDGCKRVSEGAHIVVADIIEQKRNGIVALCRKHHVRALWLFGSATKETWNPETSDVDFLVDLGGYEAGVADRYLNLADDLEALMGRRIDLVSTGGLRHNRRLREELERGKIAIYERDHAYATA
jgi:predicted nucleotidyltransferase